MLNNNRSNILLSEGLSECPYGGGRCLSVLGGGVLLWDCGQNRRMRINLVLKDQVDPAQILKYKESGTILIA